MFNVVSYMLIHYPYKVFTGGNPQSKIQIPVTHTVKYSWFFVAPFANVFKQWLFFALLHTIVNYYLRSIVEINLINTEFRLWEPQKWKASMNSVKGYPIWNWRWSWRKWRIWTTGWHCTRGYKKRKWERNSESRKVELQLTHLPQADTLKVC